MGKIPKKKQSLKILNPIMRTDGLLDISTVERYLKRYIKYFTKSLIQIKLIQPESLDDVSGFAISRVKGPFNVLNYEIKPEGTQINLILRYQTSDSTEEYLTVQFDIIERFESQRWLQKDTQEVYFLKYFEGVKDLSDPKIIRIEFEFAPISIHEYKQKKHIARPDEPF